MRGTRTYRLTAKGRREGPPHRGSRSIRSATPSQGTRRIATVPFTLRHLKEDLEDPRARVAGAPDLEVRWASAAASAACAGAAPTRRWGPPSGGWRLGEEDQPPPTACRHCAKCLPRGEARPSPPPRVRGARRSADVGYALAARRR